MKIRTGFVSNSSSSSFIVALPKKPDNTDELFKWMFPDKKPIDHLVYCDYVIHCYDAVGDVFNKITEQKTSANNKDIVKMFCSGWNFRDEFDLEYRKLKEEHDRENREFYKAESQLAEKMDEYAQKLATQAAHEFIKDNKKSFVLLTSYSDNEGEFGCVMEHGDVFNALPHQVINQH
jgi:hypothetical protein